MKRPVALFALFLCAAPHAAHAGTFAWIDDLFTFREDQKERVAPRRMLPPVEVAVPYYPEEDATSWSGYYTREDLAVEDSVGGGSKVLRPAPGSATPQQYWSTMQDRMAVQRAEDTQGRMYIGDPGTGPYMGSGTLPQGVQIGAPVGDWRTESAPGDDSAARRYGMQPRPGDFDYVPAPASRFEDTRRLDDGGRTATSPPSRMTGGRSTLYQNDPRYVDFNNKGEVTKYSVQRGDSLSTIADQSAIYDNWKLWPLIYSANKRAIGGNPHNLKVKQHLGIPRDYTEAQAKEAEKKAGRR
ncbi:MAG: hypothetical protein COY40_01815 [Alphaproteobacteria bacterium CG_4_10_14_0_8_um_filter_53_9]|nr:MAG: hypothetical protein COY40_01815 [Alphaproteobacteria bacterium CG_4_10_14_0_8_um_filter_53_9]